MKPPKCAEDALRVFADLLDAWYRDSGTGRDTAQQDCRRWANEITSLRAERDRYKAALEHIATHADCCGPYCPYCDDDLVHPLSYSAKCAIAALHPEGEK